MDKLLRARLYIPIIRTGRQAGRQAGKQACGVDGYCLAETGETPLSYIILPIPRYLYIYIYFMERTSRATRKRSRTRPNREREREISFSERADNFQ